MYDHKLPTRLLKVRVPVIATYTEEEIEMYGLPLNKVDGSVKKFDESELTVVMLKLDRIIDIYSIGYPISLINPDEVSFVYDSLEDYLKRVTGPGTYSPNAKETEEKDERFEQIELFASEIFDLNRHTIVKENIKNVRGGFDLGINTMSAVNLNISRETAERKTSVLDGYESDDSEELSTATGLENAAYINNNLPDIDPRRVKRKAIFVNTKDMI